MADSDDANHAYDAAMEMLQTMSDWPKEQERLELRVASLTRKLAVAHEALETARGNLSHLDALPGHPVLVKIDAALKEIAP